MLHQSQIHEVYRVAQKSLDTRDSMLNIECQLTFLRPVYLFHPVLFTIIRCFVTQFCPEQIIIV
jgi:hypothetical protein